MRAPKRRRTNLEKYAYGHYRKHTVKQRESAIYACDDPVKTLAVGLDGKRAEVSPLQYVPAEGLNTPLLRYERIK